VSDLLRVYWNPDEIGADGYPHAWHKPGWEQLIEASAEIVGQEAAEQAIGFLHQATVGDVVPLKRPSIKDHVRELAGNRCVRCGHPYRKGEHEMEVQEDGSKVSWSPCDEHCTHLGSVRMREVYRDGSWSEYDLSRIGQPAGDCIFDYDAEKRRIQRWEVEASWRILTVHHLNGLKFDCRWWNLASLCQRCHLTIQSKVYMERVYDKPHSEWFKPYAAGWYAWKYLDLELTREETMARLDELLDLELRQDALF
jgi:hypothetical protein